jgi:glutamine synthetase
MTDDGSMNPPALGSLQDLRDFAAEHRVEYICFRVTDLNGYSRQLALPAATVSQGHLDEGLGVGMSSYPGYRNIEASDMRLIPDLSTAYLDPCAEPTTLNLLCNIVHTDGSPFERDPRGILRRAAARLTALPHVSETMVSPELEFYIFDDVRYASGMNSSFFSIDAVEACWNTGSAEQPNLAYKFQRFTGQHASPPRDHLYTTRSAMVSALNASGVPVRYHHHEAGSAGHSEVELSFEPLLASADHLQMAKDIIKDVAVREGRVATFMPKPLFDEGGNGMHVHLYLTDGQRSLFFEEGTYGCLSELALHAVGGLLYHTPAMMAIINPSTNSYRRFGPGLAAPMNLFFSVANRSAALRIPGYSMSAADQRIEYRMPDALGNPYLTLAAIVAAMTDGIKRRISPEEHGFGPYDVNVYSLAKEKQAELPRAPGSLKEALLCLRDDHRFLTEGGVFDEAFVDDWTDLKVSQEILPLAARPHPYEFSLYFDR